MRNWKAFSLAMGLIGALAGVAGAQTQTQQAADRPNRQPRLSRHRPLPSTKPSIRIIAREHGEDATIRRYKPIVETYIQDMKPDKDMGPIPADHYFLGQANLDQGVVDDSMLTKKKGKIAQLNPLSHLTGFFEASYVPEGFLQMIYRTRAHLIASTIRSDYVGREFLGEVRCLVFDLNPAAEIR